MQNPNLVYEYPTSQKKKFDEAVDRRENIYFAISYKRLLLLRQLNNSISVIPSKDGIHNEFDWMPDQVRHECAWEQARFGR